MSSRSAVGSRGDRSAVGSRGDRSALDFAGGRFTRKSVGDRFTRGRGRHRQRTRSGHRRLTRVRYVAGPGSRAYVLVHGIGASASVLGPLARELSRTGTVYALDLPGFGGVPRPAGRARMDDFADDLRGALAPLGLERPVLLGHSMSAQVVVELLAREPRWSSAAVLVGPTVNPAEATAVRQGVRLLQSSRHDSWTVRAAIARAYLGSGPRWYARTLEGMLEHPMRERLARVRADTLVVRGAQDRVTPLPWAQEVVRLLPHARLETLPGGAHGVVWDDAADLAALVAQHAATAERDPSGADATAGGGAAPAGHSTPGLP